MTDGTEVDCSHAVSGQSIPQEVEDVTHLKSSAKAVLLVEKDATFQKLLQDPLMTSHTILITSKGMPDLNTR
jgi:DNA topoisomerase VI subunit A